MSLAAIIHHILYMHHASMDDASNVADYLRNLLMWSRYPLLNYRYSLCMMWCKHASSAIWILLAIYFSKYSGCITNDSFIFYVKMYLLQILSFKQNVNNILFSLLTLYERHPSVTSLQILSKPLSNFFLMRLQCHICSTMVESWSEMGSCLILLQLVNNAHCWTDLSRRVAL